MPLGHAQTLGRLAEVFSDLLGLDPGSVAVGDDEN
jgi:hypothetical protein